MSIPRKLRLNVKREESFRSIKAGSKRGEVRLLRGCIKVLKKNDIIYLVHRRDDMMVKICEIVRYDSIKSMLDSGDVNHAIFPDGKRVGIEFYNQFYKKEDIEKYEVVIILFNVF